MAIYKPTYCFPFATGLDARVALHSDFNEIPVIYLSCKVDTSNKNITGYKIRILSDDNQVVFEGSEISPISELTDLQLQSGDLNAELNSGVNGTFLRIPFFQNYKTKLNQSFNAIYYNAHVLADRVVYYKSGMSGADMANVNNWDYDSSNKTLKYRWSGGDDSVEARQNIIILDGEALLENDIVVVSTDNTQLSSNIDGIYQATKSESYDPNTGNAVISTVLKKKVGYSSATVVKGQNLHNTRWAKLDGRLKQSDTKTKWYKLTEGTSGLGTSQVSLFDVNNNNYKWEITFYQGNGTVDTIESNGFEVSRIRYNNVDIQWLDMTVVAGTILGSTPERIQLGGVGGTAMDGLIPEGTDADPLILQNTYAALGASVATVATGNRVGIKAYDATFAHAYPVSGSLGASDMSNYNYCQFYKHSTNPNDILDTDIINKAFNRNQTITFGALKSAKWTDYGSDEDTWENETSVLERHIFIGASNGKTRLSGVNPGDYILLWGQDIPKQNGVYQYYQENGRYCIQRAPSYETWASYLGKVIFALDNGLNYESLATAGLYTLWNPKKTDTVSGDSALYFRLEKPIVLFNNVIKKTFDVYDQVHSSSSSSRNPGIDGVWVNAGDIILYSDGRYATVQTVNGSEYTRGSVSSQISTSDYYKIRRGQQFGNTVIKRTGGDIKVTQECSTAKILKNSTSKTFITPWTDIAKTMQLKLLDGHEVGGKSWIEINGFNDKQYYITHDSLSSALESYSSTDSTIPWRYEIKTYFRTSDENPFYSYESPYIILYKNDTIFTSLGAHASRENLIVRKNIYEVEPFYVSEQGGDRQYRVAFSVPYTSIADRAVKLSAEYIQFGQSSWENYRWTLYGKNPEDGPDEYTKLLQDTGRRYDKNITATFYGLANDTSKDLPYKFILSLENDLGDIFTHEVVLTVLSGVRAKTLLDSRDRFIVYYDCTTESNVIFIDIDESSFNLQGDKTYSIYRREYEIYPKTPVISGTYLGGGVFVGDNGVYYNPSEEFYNKKQYFLSHPLVASTVSSDENVMYECVRLVGNTYTFQKTDAASFYIGDWEPVLTHTPIEKKVFRDFNISNGRSYQYVVYPGTYKIDQENIANVFQTFANYDGLIWQNNMEDSTNGEGVETIQGKIVKGSYETSSISGQPVCTKWDYWSLVELVPEVVSADVPILRKQYRANNKNIWLLKYSLEPGTQTQNISREEFNTLGRFPRFGFGELNAMSGTMSALIGSELVPSTKNKYLERLPYSRLSPLSTNEKVEMLHQWERFVYSKNPKLLRDIRGNSWIVHLTSSSLTTRDFVEPMPTTISFEWKQVDSVNGVIIYGDYEVEDEKVANSYNHVSSKTGFFATSPEVCCTNACRELDMASVLRKDYADVLNLGTSNPKNVTIKPRQDFREIFDNLEEVTDEYGNSFIKIPTLYRKVIGYGYDQLPGGSIKDFQISTTQIDDGFVPYSVFVDGDTILPYVLVGKYVAKDLFETDGVLVSQPREESELVSHASIGASRMAALSYLKAGYQQFDWQFQKLFVDLALVLGQNGVNFQNGAREIFECLNINDINQTLWVDGVRGSADEQTEVLSWKVASDPDEYYRYPNSRDDGAYALISYSRPAWGSAPINASGYMSGDIVALGYDGRYPFFNYPAKIQEGFRYQTRYCDEYYARDVDSESHIIHPEEGKPVFWNAGKNNKKFGLWYTNVAYSEYSAAAQACGRLCYRPVSGAALEQTTRPAITRDSNQNITITPQGGNSSYESGTMFMFMYQYIDGVDEQTELEITGTQPSIILTSSQSNIDLDSLGTSKLTRGSRYNVKICAWEPGKALSEPTILPGFTYPGEQDVYGAGQFVYVWETPFITGETLNIRQAHEATKSSGQLTIR